VLQLFKATGASQPFRVQGFWRVLVRCQRTDGIRSGIVALRNAQVMMVGERLHLGRTLERELHLGLHGMRLDCE
jgi:hypothetical protein